MVKLEPEDADDSSLEIIDIKRIGGNIRNLRKSRGLTQKELAKRISKSLRTLQKYEFGEIEPSLSIINEISVILNVSPFCILGIDMNELIKNTGIKIY